MPRVVVITPTWHRYEELFGRCVPSVDAQTLTDWEHVVVSDGPDFALDVLMEAFLTDEVQAALPGHRRRLLHAERPDEKGHHGARARNHGIEHSDSELVAFLDDDNAFRPQHLELLVRALDAFPAAAFAYGKLHYPQTGRTIGLEPPTAGQIDSSSFVCRRSVFELGAWPLTDVYELDWMMISGWLERGAPWVFVPEVTLDYYWPAR